MFVSHISHYGTVGWITYTLNVKLYCGKGNKRDPLRLRNHYEANTVGKTRSIEGFVDIYKHTVAIVYHRSARLC